MKFDVIIRFDKHLNEKFANKPDIAKFLVRHERKDVCIDELCTQIRLAELGLRRKMTTHSYDMLIKSTADLFAMAALNSKENELMSASERQRRLADAAYEKELQAEMKEYEAEATSTGFKNFRKIIVSK